MKKIILLIVILLLTGCYDYKELNDMNVVDAIYVDYKDNKYYVSAEIISLDNEKELEKEFITGSGKNISEAFYDIKKNSSKEIFLEHVDILCLSKNVSDNGIKDIIDYVIRDVSINNNYYVVVINDWNSIKDMDEGIGEYLVSLINNSYGENDVFTIDMLERDLIDNKDIVIPYINNLESNEIAIFSDGKLVKYVSNSIYNLLVMRKCNIVFRLDNSSINVYDKSIKYDINKDKIIINMVLNSEILEGDIKGFENELSTMISTYISNLDNDIFGFKDMYYKKFRERKKVDIEVKVKINIGKDGALTNDR